MTDGNTLWHAGSATVVLMKEVTASEMDATEYIAADWRIDSTTRHVTLFGRFFRRLQQLDAQHFVKLPGSGDLILWYWNKVFEATGGPEEYIAGRSEPAIAQPSI